MTKVFPVLFPQHSSGERRICSKSAPVALEETGGASAFKDISGSRLPEMSKWTVTLGGEASKW